MEENLLTTETVEVTEKPTEVQEVETQEGVSQEALEGQSEPQEQEEKTEFNMDTFLQENNIQEEHAGSIKQAIEDGVDPEAVKYHLESQKKFVEAEREKLSPELKGQLGDIGAFVATSEGDRKNTYNMLATTADGVKLLNELRGQAMGGTSTGTNQMKTAAAGGMDIDTFREKLMAAKKSGDHGAIASLKAYAKNSGDDVIKDYMGL